MTLSRLFNIWGKKEKKKINSEYPKYCCPKASSFTQCARGQSLYGVEVFYLFTVLDRKGCCMPNSQSQNHDYQNFHSLYILAKKGINVSLSKSYTVVLKLVFSLLLVKWFPLFLCWLSQVFGVFLGLVGFLSWGSVRQWL